MELEMVASASAFLPRERRSIPEMRRAAQKTSPIIESSLRRIEWPIAQPKVFTSYVLLLAGPRAESR
jgi:hypothetical protein